MAFSEIFELMDVLAFLWLLTAWYGYTRFAKHKAKNSHCLASVLHRHRVNWMQNFLRREQRVADAAFVANIERNVSFFASTTLLVLAGLVTALAAADKVQITLSLLPFAEGVSAKEVEFKFLVLICIFIYAFFTFTWSLRQFGFVSVLMGAAPEPIKNTRQPLSDDSPFDKTQDEEDREVEIERYAKYTAKVLDQAGHSFNYGLRSYYFALATMAWFLDPRLIFVSVSVVVLVLYVREFRSSSLEAMLNISK